jgi:type III secretory pathway component EscU
VYEQHKRRIDTECTFEPILKQNKRYMVSSDSTFLERAQVWQEHKIEKMLREKEEEVNKDYKECTFAPKINSKSRRYLQ